VTRAAVLAQVADLVLRVAERDEPSTRDTGPIVRIAIDGVDGVGKSVFGDELATALGPHRPVIRASVDGFHQPPEVRHGRGRGSPEGFFLDSYRYDELERVLLAPLAPGGSRRYRRAVYDVVAESPVDAPVEVAAPDSILVFDGIFLHRPELRHHWDLSIYLDAPFDVTIPRGARRGTGSPDPHAASNRRYVEGQRLYLASCDPAGQANVVIDHADLDHPRITALRPVGLDVARAPRP
jgi:uridine kinase